MYFFLSAGVGVGGGIEAGPGMLEKCCHWAALQLKMVHFKCLARKDALVDCLCGPLPGAQKLSVIRKAYWQSGQNSQQWGTLKLF